MKFTNLFLLLALVLVGFTSCKKDKNEPDIAKEVVSTYNGTFNSATTQSLDFDVVVSKVSNTKIKITPEEGTAFEVSMEEKDGAYNGDKHQVIFRTTNGIMSLTYNNADAVEQFTGVKK